MKSDNIVKWPHNWKKGCHHDSLHILEVLNTVNLRAFKVSSDDETFPMVNFAFHLLMILFGISIFFYRQLSNLTTLQIVQLPRNMIITLSKTSFIEHKFLVHLLLDKLY